MENIFEYNNQLVMDSRLVAGMVGKNHKDLMRDIRGYITAMEDGSNLSRLNEEDLGWDESTRVAERRFAPADFFLGSNYKDKNNQERPCYLLTKMGCEFVANKLTGTKGVLFTATYVSEFNRMERIENEKKMIGERNDFGEIASIMKEFRLWAKAMKMPHCQAMEAMTKFFHNTGVPFPEEMVYNAPIKIIPRQIAFWNKEHLEG